MTRKDKKVEPKKTTDNKDVELKVEELEERIAPGGLWNKGG